MTGITTKPVEAVISSKAITAVVVGESATRNPNLVVNADFADGLTGWTQNANAVGKATVVAGELVYSNPHGDYAETKQLNGSIIGKTYNVEFDVVAKVDAAILVSVYFGRTAVLVSLASSIPLGKYTRQVTSVHLDGFSISVRTNGEITIDNVYAAEA